MMLIRNDEERERTGMMSLDWVCGACNKELRAHYPVIFVGDRNRTAYHLACAALLVSEITDAIADYLAAEQPK